MSVNEEEVKIRERLVSLETKLDFLSVLLQEIRDGLKDTPSKEDYSDLESRLSKLEDKQTSMVIKVGIVSSVMGTLAGLFIKYLVG